MQIIGELKPKEKADQLIWLMPLILPVIGHIHSVSFLSPALHLCTHSSTCTKDKVIVSTFTPPPLAFLPLWKIYMLFFSSSFMQRPRSPVDPLRLPLHSQSLHKHSWQEVDGRVPSNKSIPIQLASRVWVSAFDTHFWVCVCEQQFFRFHIYVYTTLACDAPWTLCIFSFFSLFQLASS